MVKRVFISIDPPEDVQRKIEEIQKLLPKFEGKKTKKENLHLTLKFLGNVSDEQILEIDKRLKELRLKKFLIRVDGIGVFSERFIRIVWLHLSGCEELQSLIDTSLSDLFKKEERFMSHLTIARVRKLFNKTEFMKDIKKINLPNITFEISCFKLKESILGEEGPLYKTLVEYPLYGVENMD